MRHSQHPVQRTRALDARRDVPVGVPAPRAGSPLDLLAAGVPLTLLLDLADPCGPDSASIYEDEADEDAAAGGASSWYASASA